jgi:predicted phage replisome organizer
MTEISWIKLKTKMFDDEKIQLIEAMPEADAVLIIWVKLLILAGKTNANGYILLAENIPYSPEMLSTIFRRPLQILKFALKVLKDFEMIDVTDSNVICINNWERHQNIEGLEKVREQNRIRQNKHREQKRLLENKNKGNITLQSRDVTQQIKSKNIEKEEDYTVIPFSVLLTEAQNNSKEFLKVWSDWCSLNEERKTRIPYHTAKEQLKVLGDLGIDEAIEMLRESIQNNWKGIFKKKENKKSNSNNPIDADPINSLKFR